MLTDEQTRWIREQAPTPVRELMRRFPPGARVRSTLGGLPGLLPNQSEGIVQAYSANRGTVTVLWEQGDLMGVAQRCRPDALEVVGYGDITPGDIRQALVSAL